MNDQYHLWAGYGSLVFLHNYVYRTGRLNIRLLMVPSDGVANGAAGVGELVPHRTATLDQLQVVHRLIVHCSISFCSRRCGGSIFLAIALHCRNLGIS